MNVEVVNLNSCRFCKSVNLTKFLDYQNIPFFDEIVDDDSVGDEFLGTMAVFLCIDCKLVQSQHDIDILNYYDNYQYNASDSKFIQDYMNLLAQKLWTEYNFSNETKVIEIGAADGFQLQCFLKLGAEVLGFEPAINLVELASRKSVEMIAELFDENSVSKLPTSFSKVSCVLMLHTFDHIGDPLQVLLEIRKILHPSHGVLLIEVHDLVQMIQNQEIALFGHEHTIFLTPYTIEMVLAKAGFKIIDFDFIPKNLRRGTSMVIVAAPEDSFYKKAQLPDSSNSKELMKLDTYLLFAEEIKLSMEKLRNYVLNKRLSGLKIAGYGGWGRGVTFLSMANLDARDFIFICDQNPALHGKLTPGSNIRILHPDNLIRESIDEVIVFNHAYIKEIESQQTSFLQNGGRLTSVLSVLNG
jgi:SAM-dependent methyltransferase